MDTKLNESVRKSQLKKTIENFVGISHSKFKIRNWNMLQLKAVPLVIINYNCNSDSSMSSYDYPTDLELVIR